MTNLIVMTCLVGMTQTCTVPLAAGSVPAVGTMHYVACLAYTRIKNKINRIDPLDYFYETAEECRVTPAAVTIRGKPNTRYTIRVQVYDWPIF